MRAWFSVLFGSRRRPEPHLSPTATPIRHKETFCAEAWPDCDSSEANALETFILGSRRGAAMFQLVAVPAACALPRVLAGNYDPGIDKEVRKLHKESPCVFCPVGNDIMNASGCGPASGCGNDATRGSAGVSDSAGWAARGSTAYEPRHGSHPLEPHRQNR